MGGVPDPDPVALPRNLRQHGRFRPWPVRLAGQLHLVLERDPQHRRGRDEHDPEPTAAVRDLAMRAVDLAPLLDQIQDLGLLPGEQAVDRAATGIAVLQAAGMYEPLPPPVRADVGEVEHLARSSMRPTVPDRAVDQPQQLELGLRAHARGNRAEKPERCFPRCNVSSIAISFRASERRSFSARSSSSSTASADTGRPGLAEVNAAIAASFANARSRTMTDTSTPYFRAASACEISCEVTSRNTSHFSSGESCLRGLRLPLSIITTSWSEVPTASQARRII